MSGKLLSGETPDTFSKYKRWACACTLDLKLSFIPPMGSAPGPGSESVNTHV